MNEPNEPESRLDRARERKEPLLFVVDETCCIVYGSLENSSEQLVDFCPEPGRLRPDICDTAKMLISSSEVAEAATPRSAFVAPGHLLRLRRLQGAGKPLFALLLEPFRSRDSILVAARRYALTKREVEILVLILEGANAPEISAALHISEHTVSGYFKRLLKKTDSRNRASMVANVLEWAESSGGKRAPEPTSRNKPINGSRTT